MEIAVYGGSFNPPHVGHAMVAAWLLWTRRAEQVWLLPAHQHAFEKSLTSFALRCSMCEALAASLSDAVKVCAVEGELPTPSYTYNTLRHLRATHPQHRFRLVLGADNLSSVHQWFRWEDLMAEFEPILVGRAGYPEVVDSPTFPDVSSTAVRQRIFRGEPVDHLLMPAVERLATAAYRSESA